MIQPVDVVVTNATGKPALVPDASLKTIVVCLLNQPSPDEFYNVLDGDSAIYPGKPFSQVLAIPVHYSKHFLCMRFFVCTQFAFIIDLNDQHSLLPSILRWFLIDTSISHCVAFL